MDFKEVFEAYPDVDEIYVVDGMPFISMEHARGHAASVKKPVETVKRAAAKKSDKPAQAIKPE